MGNTGVSGREVTGVIVKGAMGNGRNWKHRKSTHDYGLL